jgi:chaperone LolA
MAGEGIDRLQAFYDGVKSLRADFHQILLDADGNTIQESDGSVQIQRPGKFYWDYKTPYPQQIVTNGVKLWIYDSDLEQVTVKSAKESLGNAPALVLSGKRPLQENFDITEQGKISGYLWVELTPKKTDNEFSIVRLGFDQELALMEVVDGFGQVTRLWLKNVVRNPGIDNKLFDFVIPKGVDVVGE